MCLGNFPLNRSGRGYSADGHQVRRPGGRAASLAPSGVPAGEAAPTRGWYPRHQLSPPGPSTETSESPLPALTLRREGEGRAEPQAPPPLQVFQRRRRQRGERSRLCRRGRPRSGAEPPPGPAQPGPRAGRARPPGLRRSGRPLRGLGQGRDAFPPAVRAALSGKRGESPGLGPFWGSDKLLDPSPKPRASAPACWGPQVFREEQQEILKCFGCHE